MGSAHWASRWFKPTLSSTAEDLPMVCCCGQWVFFLLRTPFWGLGVHRPILKLSLWCCHGAHSPGCSLGQDYKWLGLMGNTHIALPCCQWECSGGPYGAVLSLLLLPPFPFSLFPLLLLLPFPEFFSPPLSAQKPQPPTHKFLRGLFAKFKGTIFIQPLSLILRKGESFPCPIPERQEDTQFQTVRVTFWTVWRSHPSSRMGHLLILGASTETSNLAFYYKTKKSSFFPGVNWFLFFTVNYFHGEVIAFRKFQKIFYNLVQKPRSDHKTFKQDEVMNKHLLNTFLVVKALCWVFCIPLCYSVLTITLWRDHYYSHFRDE